jgi:hypothetical protein
LATSNVKRERDIVRFEVLMAVVMQGQFLGYNAMWSYAVITQRIRLFREKLISRL